MMSVRIPLFASAVVKRSIARFASVSANKNSKLTESGVKDTPSPPTVTTHFGYETVAEADKERLGVFH